MNRRTYQTYGIYGQKKEGKILSRRTLRRRQREQWKKEK